MPIYSQHGFGKIVSLKFVRGSIKRTLEDSKGSSQTPPTAACYQRTMANSSNPSKELLEAALHGLEAQKQKLERQIVEVRSLLGKRRGRPPKRESGLSVVAAAPLRKKRVLSTAARKSIAAAQKKRWAAFHKAQAEG